jgi:hypothetical protein
MLAWGLVLACPAASRTINISARSSIDQAGGKRLGDRLMWSRKILGVLDCTQHDSDGQEDMLSPNRYPSRLNGAATLYRRAAVYRSLPRWFLRHRLTHQTKPFAYFTLDNSA